MPDWNSLQTPPYIRLIFGIIFFAAGVVSTCAGKTYGRYGGWAYRAKEPTQFWLAVAIYYLGGILCVGLFLLSQACSISTSASP
jgi:hypothetical protein